MTSIVGTSDIHALRKQTCSAGCVAGLMVMAGIVGIVSCLLVCCCFWPAPELISRQERRAAALKRRQEREEEEEEARAKNEELAVDDDEEEVQHNEPVQTREAPEAEEDDSEEL